MIYAHIIWILYIYNIYRYYIYVYIHGMLMGCLYDISGVLCIYIYIFIYLKHIHIIDYIL